MRSDLIIIAECGCPTPQWNICNGCGCCTDCCDGFACDHCGEKCKELFDAHPLVLCEDCLEKYLEDEA